MSSEVTVILPDGSERILGPNATGADLAAELGARAAREALVAIVDGDQFHIVRKRETVEQLMENECLFPG